MSDEDTYPIPEKMEEIDLQECERQLVLSKLMEAIDYLHNKCLHGQIKKPETDRVRVSYFKALSQACSVYNQISRDIELDDLKNEVEELKRLME